ncbi:MAG: 50S ribosomal protein L6 [Nitrospirae bacterium]|nr:50S ribosomal protein L6 [Nitrospirota bacterium]
MSRIGKNPIKTDTGIDVKIEGRNISVKGPKGSLKWDFPPQMKVSVKDNSIIVERLSDSKDVRMLHGTTRSIISNMVTGVREGYRKTLQIIGVGYRAQVQGSQINFSIGYSHPVVFLLPQGISAEIDKKQTTLVLSGIDKHLIGQVAANIKAIRPPDAYKGKGIRFEEEQIKLKAGKTGAK